MSKPTLPGNKLNRRRFLKICAASATATALSAVPAFATPRVHHWSGIALGAKAEINLVHDDADVAQSTFKDVETEIHRLEAIFSLYQSDSELARLNKDGVLKAPSLDMLKLLGQAGRLHQETNGAFDPTVQSLWAFYAEGTKDRALHLDAMKRTGFSKVRIEPAAIGYDVPGMGMTLNGIAQGYITDRISELLKRRGFQNVAVDIGELNLMGSAPDRGTGWTVTLMPDSNLSKVREKQSLSNKAVASSAQTGTTFDEANKTSHILDPRTGMPVQSDLRAISVIADNATIADGLSTAALVMGKEALAEVLANFDGVRAFAIRQTGESIWLGQA